MSGASTAAARESSAPLGAGRAEWRLHLPRNSSAGRALADYMNSALSDAAGEGAPGATAVRNPEQIHTEEREREQVRYTLAAMECRAAELLLLRSHGLSHSEVATALELNPARLFHAGERISAEDPQPLRPAVLCMGLRALLLQLDSP